MSEPSLINITINLVKRPQSAFVALEGQGKAWFPLCVIISVNLLFLILYYQALDYDWAFNRMLETQTQDMSPAQVNEFRSRIELVGWKGLIATSVGAIILMFPLMFALYSVYLLIISNIKEDDLTFGECFTITAWGNLVGVVSVLVGLLRIPFYNNGQIPDSLSRGLNLNDLIFGLAPTEEFYGLLSNFDLSALWAGALIAIGYKTFTKSSMITSLVISFAPMAIITGLVIYF